MKSVLEQLSRRVREGMNRAGFEGDPVVRATGDGKFGHYQSNCAMGLAKKAGQPPRQVAEAIVAKLELEEMCSPPNIAGPGFINFRLTSEFLGKCLAQIPPCPDPSQDRLGIERTDSPEVVVVDLSSPNLAKEMHVGHLRSTVIGDCVARILEFQGHTVHRENHVGDWGTQFGMLIAHLRSTKPEVLDQPDSLVISDLESFYVKAKSRFDSDDEFKQESRDAVVALQKGDPVTRRIWRAFCDESLRHCHDIYDRLGVVLIDRGESFYTEMMGEVIQRLEARMEQGADDLVRVSDGALCVFMEGFTTRGGDPLPLIARKSDGAYNYATSDLTTIVHRVEQLKATRILYVVGIAQQQHFAMVFEAVRAVGWIDKGVTLKHLGFGNMLAKNGRPFKTREGGTVKLKTLLDEAVARARRVVEASHPDQSRDREGAVPGDSVGPLHHGCGSDNSEASISDPSRDRKGAVPGHPTEEPLPYGRGSEKLERVFLEDQIERIAETVGLGAVKYFDLSHSLSSDYRFDLDTMLSMEGNTAPYLIYAYARIRSIGRKAGIDFATLPADAPILPDHPTELQLAVKIAQFAETLDLVGRELKPNVLTDYLFELAKTFSRFYDKKLGVRVIDASPDLVRISRLRLCDLTARVLRRGLHLLGIDTLEQM